ncbi:fructosamine kinase family protein [Herpetosiphon giganteus]|uniref:fructosamine kinase family protein n=1 Tax=Herpetosiphon giganteus TaxID=2029754 RepID=UPI001956BEFB|nr:fructosamine kinase family protein [Herpetosiphon giganteus]MBM7844321.1 fructosamine-3-kinase [Herpetosiphon giganteus]
MAQKTPSRELMLPASIQHSLEQHFAATIRPIKPIYGGDINHAVQIQIGQQTALLKWRVQPANNFFVAEADGLACLAAAKTLAVPAVLGLSQSWLVLEWFEAQGRYQAGDLGAGLAQLHRNLGPSFGYSRANFIGALAQPNQPSTNWAEFWRDQRLWPQVELAAQAGHMPKQRQQQCLRLADQLDRLLAHQPQPSLVHGDLWAGNVITTNTGQPGLIDPAVSYSDRETDIAFASLFGGFGSEFLSAYQAMWPLPNEYHERQPLYQLYWLLVHLTLFG